jgi:hypothetical protein
MAENNIGGETKRPREDQNRHPDPALQEARAPPRIEESEKAQARSPARIDEARILLPDLDHPEPEEKQGDQKEALKPYQEEIRSHIRYKSKL